VYQTGALTIAFPAESPRSIFFLRRCRGGSRATLNRRINRTRPQGPTNTATGGSPPSAGDRVPRPGPLSRAGAGRVGGARGGLRRAHAARSVPVWRSGQGRRRFVGSVARSRRPMRVSEPETQCQYPPRSVPRWPSTSCWHSPIVFGHTWRRLKTSASWRVVPLWPQLEEILRPYLDQRVVDHAAGCASPRSRRAAKPCSWRRGGCWTGLRRGQGGSGVRSGTGSSDTRYCAARLGTIRHRAEVVEYRVEQHFERLADRLVRLGFDTTTVTTEHGEAESTTPRERETLNGGGEFR
jgi:hypothetical protein